MLIRCVLLLSVLVGTAVGTTTDTNFVATATTNQLTLGTTKTTTISATAPSASLTLTIPDPGASANVLHSGPNAQTLTSASLTVQASNPVVTIKNTGGSGAAVLAIDGSSGTTASITAISSGRLTIANGQSTGTTRFTSNSVAICEVGSSSTPGFTIFDTTSTNNILLNVASLAASRTYTWPDAGTNAGVVLNRGNVTFSTDAAVNYMFFDSRNGRLGLGVLPPKYRLHVGGGAYVDSLTLPSPGGTSSPITVYEEYNFASGATGPCTISSKTFKVVKSNSVVTIYSPSSGFYCVTTTANKAFTFGQKLPTRFVNTNTGNGGPTNCNIYTTGQGQCNTVIANDGTITIYADLLSGTFSTGQNAPWFDSQIVAQYNIAA